MSDANVAFWLGVLCGGPAYAFAALILWAVYGETKDWLERRRERKEKQRSNVIQLFREAGRE